MANDVTRWVQGAIDAASARVDAELSSYADAAGGDEFLRTRIGQLADDLSPGTSLLRFTYVTALLRRLVAQSKTNDSEITRLLEIGHGLLAVEGITATSILSHLLGELHVLKALQHAALGEMSQAIWQSLTADRQAQRSRHESSEMRRLLVQAQLRLRVGHTSFAIEACRVVEAFDDPEMSRIAALWRVRALRLSGDRRTATQALVEARRLETAPEKSSPLRWEEGLLEAVGKGELRSLLLASGKGESCHTPAHVITFALWAKAVRSRTFLEKAVKSRTIRRAFPGEITRQSAETVVLQALDVLDDAYDNTLPLEVRLNALGTILETRKHVASVEWELLILAAASRCLARLSQDSMTVAFVAEYRALSLTLSSGASHDVLAVMPDLLKKPWFRDTTAETDEAIVAADANPFNVKRNAFIVGLEASKLSARLGQTVVATKFRKIMASQEEKQRLDELQRERIAEALTDFMGDFKGGVMKLGQMLSWASFPLPEEYRAQFASLQAAAEPIDHDVMRAMFREEFGALPEDCFAEWDGVPIAVASVSQVYRARLKDGRSVAVKMLFPGIEGHVRNTFRRIRALRPIIQSYLPASNVQMLEEEIEKHIIEECDLRIEARNHRDFAVAVANVPRAKVAEIIPEYSSRHVLTTTFIEGKRLNDFIEEATPAEVSAAGHVIGHASLYCFLEHGLLNVDPNPANFLFGKDGVYFLDFGCFKRWPKAAFEPWMAVIRSGYENDLEAHRAALIATKAITNVERYDYQYSLDETRLLFAPLLSTDAFTITDQYVQDRIGKMRSPNMALFAVDPDLIMGMRAILGLMSMAAKLKVNSAWGDLCLPYFIKDKAAKKAS